MQYKYNTFVNEEKKIVTVVMPKNNVRAYLLRFFYDRFNDCCSSLVNYVIYKYITRDVVVHAMCSDNDVFDAEKGKRICEKRLAIELCGLRKSIASHYVAELYKEIGRAADIWMLTDQKQENIREALRKDVE